MLLPVANRFVAASVLEHARRENDNGVGVICNLLGEHYHDLAGACEVWQYAPYGTAWPAYFWRRLLERRENALFALRAIAGA